MFKEQNTELDTNVHLVTVAKNANLVTILLTYVHLCMLPFRNKQAIVDVITFCAPNYYFMHLF